MGCSQAFYLNSSSYLSFLWQWLLVLLFSAMWRRVVWYLSTRLHSDISINMILNSFCYLPYSSSCLNKCLLQNLTETSKYRDEQIPVARSPGWQHFWWWCLIIFYHPVLVSLCFIVLTPRIFCYSYIFGKFVYPRLTTYSTACWLASTSAPQPLPGAAKMWWKGKFI